MAVDVFISADPVDVHIFDASFEVLAADESLDIHVGLDGATGPRGEEGQPGKDGVAEIPPVLDGGNF